MLHAQVPKGGCLPPVSSITALSIAGVDGVVAALAFVQLLRIHFRNTRVGWTRQKVFHLLIGSSSAGYTIYFCLTLLANCKEWSCWSHACGFILISFPQILFVATYLLLLSFWFLTPGCRKLEHLLDPFHICWLNYEKRVVVMFYRVDLCHQASDVEEDEDESLYQKLLDKTNSRTGFQNVDSRRKWFTLHATNIGGRQKIVLLVTVILFLIAISAAALIWIGMEENPIDSSFVTRVYLISFGIMMLILAAGLTYYGIVLYSKMSKVRSERASSEIRKVAGLAAISVVCFIVCAVVAVVTSVPVLNYWNSDRIDAIYASLMTILYYFVGSSVPSCVVLWVMREMPHQSSSRRSQPGLPVVVGDPRRASVTHSQHWISSTSAQNQSESHMKLMLGSIGFVGSAEESNPLSCAPCSHPVKGFPTVKRCCCCVLSS